TGRIPTSCLKKYSLNRVSNFMGSLQNLATLFFIFMKKTQHDADALCWVLVIHTALTAWLKLF
ncbi:hypothetical protein, partial [Ligilactobacillus murinus]|uniref:hypothetical protein n=1 Tax=Ligilactobacillus murinus TaxID=1622 RepID=UPI001C8B9591